MTQVCSQIRKESRSLCLKRVPKWIELGEVSIYAETFHSDLGVGDTIHVDLNELAGRDRKVVDILGLFLHLSDHPNVACTFESTYFLGRGPVLWDLLPILTRSAKQAHTADWKAAASNIVSITPKTSTKNLIVTLKLACKLKARSTARKEFEADMRNKLGLERHKSWGVVFKYDSTRNGKRSWEFGRFGFER